MPQQIISDKGSDLYKGIKLYQSENKSIIHSHDLSHQMALLLKKELEQESDYQLFAKKCHQTRQQIQQTELAFLMPPKQRSKSRYLNLDELINWGRKIINYLEKEKIHNKNKKEKSSEWLKLNIKLGWIEEYKEKLRIWQEMLSITPEVEKQVKTEGLTQDSCLQLEKKNQEKLVEEKVKPRVNKFREKIKEALDKEIENIQENEAINISSDVIESLFGKYKYFSSQCPLKEIRRIILTIPLSTLDITVELIKKALETVKNADVADWEEKTFGKSILSKRRMALNCSD